MTIPIQISLAQFAENVVSELHDRGLEAEDVLRMCDATDRDTDTVWTTDEVNAVRHNALNWQRESNGLLRLAPDADTV